MQDRSGLGNGLDMRSLEHCLSDIMRGVGDGSGPPDHLKGKYLKISIPTGTFYYMMYTNKA